MTDCEELVEWLKSYYTPTEDLVDAIYPIGSIYLSVNNTSPATLFGGTWEKIEGRFLLGSGTTSGTTENYTAGNSDGESKHTLTVDEMPEHNHTQAQHRHDLSVNWSNGSGSSDAVTHTSNRKAVHRYTSYEQPVINNTGGGQAHNNMPPYLVVNIWKRTE